MSSFRDKVKEIRASEQQRVRDRVPLSDEELGLNDGTDRYLMARDQIAKEIAVLMQDFISEAQAFAISRGFFEGKYSIALSCDELYLDTRGEAEKAFSRINFLLDPYSPDNRFSITSKLTILNRDLPKAIRRGSLEDDPLTRFTEFAEEQMLRFAQEYFAARRPSPETVPHTS